MPSDGSGNYSLPAGYLAVTGDTIVISQHNPIFEDVSSALSARIMASGVRPMTGPLKLADGTVSLPALALASQPSWGLYKTATGFGVAISATKVVEIVPAGIIVTGTQTVSSDQTVSGNQTVVKTQTLKDGGDIASATALTLGDGNFFNITGTTATTSIVTKGAGTVVKLRANAAWPITHHATNLILLTGASITAAAGDMMEFEEYETGHWRMTAYHRATGASLLQGLAPTVQSFVTGTSATYTTPANVKYIRVRAVGAGGGGGGCGTGTSAGSGGTGGTTTFNSVNATGGGGGARNSTNDGGAGGAGGTGGTGTATWRVVGGDGGAGGYVGSAHGGLGGASFFGGGGRPGPGSLATAAGSAGLANGSGGGGANAVQASFAGGAGGAAGEYFELIIGSPAATYTYTVGAGGTAGTAGTSGAAGGLGAVGRIIVEEFYA